MEYEEINDFISLEEYEDRSNNFYGVTHKLRSELSKEKIELLKKISDEFIEKWKIKLLGDMADYWLSGGATGQFKQEP